MSETDHTPKMFAKFIQLMSHSNELWALDENGDCFYRDVKNRIDDHPVWRKTKTVRDSDDES